MLKRNVFLTLDCAKHGCQCTVEGLHVGDIRSCELHILLRNGIVPLIFDDENISVIMNAQKPDGTTISALCDISADKKEVIYRLDVQDTAVEGVVSYQLIVAAYDGDEYCVLYSASFSTVVSAGIVVPVFKQLESQPDNWATDYKKYFRHTQNGYAKITDENCPTFNSNDFYYLVNPNYDSENDYSAFADTVANVQNLIVKMTAAEAKNTEQDTAIRGKANIADVPTKTSDLTNDSGFLTQQSLSNYYNKTDVNDMLNGKANASHTHSEYLTEQDISDKADVNHTHSQYLTAQDIEDKADKLANGNSGELVSATNNGNLQRSGYSVTTDDTKIVDNDNVNKYVPNAQAIAKKIAGKANANHIHPQYLTTQDILNKANKSTTLEGYGITDAYTKAEVDNKGYLTNQDISGKEDTSNKKTSLSSSSTDAEYPSAKCVFDALDGKANVSDVYIKAQVDAKLGNKVENSTFSQYQSSVYTKTEIDNKGYLTDQDISDKEDKSNKVSSLTQGLTGRDTTVLYPTVKAVKTYVEGELEFYALEDDIPTATSDLLNDSGFLTQHQSLSAYYTSAQVDAAIQAAIGGVENGSY